MSFPFQVLTQLLYSQVDTVGTLTRILAPPILFFPSHKICADISLITSQRNKNTAWCFHTALQNLQRSCPPTAHSPPHPLSYSISHMAIKLSVHNAEIVSLIFPVFFIFRGQLTCFLLLHSHCLAILL
jgi:hypothetical protein